MLETILQLWPKSTMTQTLLIGISVGVCAYFLLKKRYKLPPGPRAWPFIGNLLELRNCLMFCKLHEWSEVYGPVMKIKMGFTDVVVLSKIDAVWEALVKRQADFAGRPFNYTAHIMTKGGQDIVQATYGPRWKLHRKLSSKAIRQYLMGDNLSKKVSESLALTVDLMKKKTGPFDPFDYVSLLVFNILSGMCFNKISPSTDDEAFQVFVVQTEKIMKEFGDGLYEDFIPPLRLYPTARFRRAVKMFDPVMDIINKDLARHKRSFSKDNIRDFTDAMLLAQKEAQLEEDPVLLSQITDTHVEMTVADIFSAGINTSRGTLRWAVLAMALHQDVQKKVQEEVDPVIGPDLKVSVTDRERLPYTEAVIHEVMRLRTVVPLGVPHETMKDTEVGGYEIPKGTMVMINHHALHFDTDQWEDVHAFKPERFLESSGKMAPKPDSWLPFSAGRRVCLGETVARPELHLLLAGICRAFTINLAPGTTHDFEPKSTGVLNETGPYKVVVKPRI